MNGEKEIQKAKRTEGSERAGKDAGDEHRAGEPVRREGGDGDAGEQAGEARGGSLRLTDRDRELMAAVATVRYLAMEQLKRLFFPQRNGINLHKRLLALAGEGRHAVPQAYLKRLTYRNWEGMPLHAWALTPLGYAVGAGVLREPPKTPLVEAGANFVEHGLMLNELYVQLLEAPLKFFLADARAKAKGAARPSRAFNRLKANLYARATQARFRWHTTDAVRLPWRESDRDGKTRDRVLVPDAVLELPAQSRRFFLECETGSHSIVAESDEKQGATLAKLARYEEYVHGFAGNLLDGDRSTWYSKQHPDGFAPKVIFLVRTEARQASVNAAIEEWRTKGHRLRAEAYTVERAAASFLKKLGPTNGEDAQRARGNEQPGAGLRGPRTVASGELRLLIGHCYAAHVVIKQARADARARGSPVPDYPADQEQIAHLLAKLDPNR